MIIVLPLGAFWRRIAIATAFVFTTSLALAEPPPAQIRLGGPAVAVSGKDYWGWGLLGIAYTNGLFQEEFKNDATTLKFISLNTVPMVGEAMASNQLDFAGQGDLISLIGRSAGVRTRYILPVSKLSNAYLAVKQDSSIKSVADLKGKRVAYLKGNYIHLQVIRILAANGLSERDVRQVSLDQATANAALATGDIDALFGGPEALLLRNKGIARIVYTTRDRDINATAQTGLIVRDDFAKQYPQTTARIVKVLVRAAQWGSDPANEVSVFGPWWSFRLQDAIREDTNDRSWSQRASPLFDPFLVAQYHDTYRLAKELKLVRGKDFDLDQWMDHSFLDQVLKDLQLENHWQPMDAQGTPIAEVKK